MASLFALHVVENYCLRKQVVHGHMVSNYHIVRFSAVNFPLYEYFYLLSLFSAQKPLKPLTEWQFMQHIWIYIGWSFTDAVKTINWIPVPASAVILCRPLPSSCGAVPGASAAARAVAASSRCEGPWPFPCPLRDNPDSCEEVLKNIITLLF